MDAFFLQKELAKEIQNITQDLQFVDGNGKIRKLNVFEQRLPYQYEEEKEDTFPFAIVRLENGTSSKNDVDNVVTVTIIIGLQDENPENSGEKQIIGIIQRIIHRFSENPCLSTFVNVGDITWSLESEDQYPYDTYPFSFGGIAMTFQIVKIEREESIYA